MTIDNTRCDDVLVSVAAVLPPQAVDIARVIDRVRDVISRCVQHYEVLLIDSGSAIDVSPCVMELQTRIPNLRLIHLSRTYGREVAIAAALEHSVGDYVVIVDLVSDPIELIPAMLRLAMEGFDAVVAEPREDRIPFLHHWIAGPAYRVVGKLLGFQLRPDESYFRLFSRRLVNSIIRIKSKQRYLGCLNGMVGFRQRSLSYDRMSSAVRNPARDLLRQLRTASGILVSNSAAPLRFASLLGLLASMANIVYLVYILIVTLVKRKLAEGWLTTSISQTIMFLMLFLIMSILSEYIARILDETKEQPLYFVEYETHSTVADEGGQSPIALGAAAGVSSPYQDRLNVV